MKKNWIFFLFVLILSCSICFPRLHLSAQTDMTSQESVTTTIEEPSKHFEESTTSSLPITSVESPADFSTVESLPTTGQKSSTTSEQTEEAETKQESASGERAIYRLYQPSTGEHLYTTDINEKNVLYGQHGWGYEGVAWYAPNAGTAVYRLYNPGLKRHLYTSDLNEVQVLTSRHGWQSDNNGHPVFYSGGSIQIYRLYHSRSLLHHWTMDANEYQILPRHGWKQEGVSFSGTKKGQPIQTQYAVDEAIAANIRGFGGYNMPSSRKRELVAAIKELSRQRYSIGFVMMDVHSQRGVEYNADQQFYAASTVKGPFVASLAAKNPNSIRESGGIMRQVLSYSSNEGYLYLVNRYTFATWRPWLAEAGVRASIANNLYPYYSARELFNLWRRNYTYFTFDPTGQQIGLWFENPNFSPIKSVLGGRYRTRSKAGWIAGWGLHSASDAGIVYAHSGPYIIAIMTNADAKLNELNGTVQALNTLVSVLNESHLEMGQQ